MSFKVNNTQYNIIINKEEETTIKKIEIEDKTTENKFDMLVYDPYIGKWKIKKNLKLS